MRVAAPVLVCPDEAKLQGRREMLELGRLLLRREREVLDQSSATPGVPFPLDARAWRVARAEMKKPPGSYPLGASVERRVGPVCVKLLFGSVQVSLHQHAQGNAARTEQL